MTDSELRHLEAFRDPVSSVRPTRRLPREWLREIHGWRTIEHEVRDMILNKWIMVILR